MFSRGSERDQRHEKVYCNINVKQFCKVNYLPFNSLQIIYIYFGYPVASKFVKIILHAP